MMTEKGEGATLCTWLMTLFIAGLLPRYLAKEAWTEFERRARLFFSWSFSMAWLSLIVISSKSGGFEMKSNAPHFTAFRAESIFTFWGRVENANDGWRATHLVKNC